MDNERMDNCNVCMKLYDDKIRPRSLPCGHSYCAACLGRSIKNKILQCPHCQKKHRASTPDVFPINYGMEAIILNFRDAQQGATFKKQSKGVNTSGQSSNPTSKLTLILTEQKENLTTQIRHGECLQKKLQEYEHFLQEREAQHQDLIASNEYVIQQINTEYEKVVGITEEGKKHTKDASQKLKQFDTCSTTKEIVIAIDDLEKIHDSIENWKTTCQTQLPNEETAKSSQTVLKATRTVMRMINGDDANLGQYLTENVHWLSPISTLSLTKLKIMSKSIKKALEKGNVYAIQNKEGRLRSAKITVTEGRTFLHYLKDERHPHQALTIQQSELISSLNHDAVEAFLDFSWGGTLKGRVFIMLSPDTLLARHFRILCTGEVGPTYVDTTLLEVGNKGDAVREWIRGGNYRVKYSRLSTPLLNEKRKACTGRNVSGAVKALFYMNDNYSNTEFKITIGRGNRFKMCPVIGRVQNGIGILKEAAKQDDISSVIIEDCGVVLPL